VTNPLPSPLGSALFRVNAVLSASEVPFEDAREQLEAEFAADRARRMIGDMIGELDDLLAGGATLEELAAETEMELGQIDWRQDVSDGVAAYDVFRDAALVTEEGDFPELIELAEGGLVALRVDEVQPPRLQPLTEIRADVVTQWELAEAESRLETQAQEAAEAIRSGAEMAGLDLPLATDREILRDAFLEGSPPDFVEGVFQMREGDVRVFRADGGAVLVRLDVIRPPVPDDAEAQTLKAGFTLQTEQEIAADLLQLYSARLQSQADIQVNQQAINAVHTQFP
jgi:peptidyl-prolyl cis-trans isomerase D